MTSDAGGTTYDGLCAWGAHLMVDESKESLDVAALKRGDEVEWGKFFVEHDRLIKSVVAWPKWRLDKFTQEDVAQIIRKELVKSISNFRGDSKLSYFVKRICIHRIIDEIRKQVRKNQVISSSTTQVHDGEVFEISAVAGEEFDPVLQVVAFERANALRASLEEMEEICSSAIREFYFEGLTYKQIADRHGISINTVGSRLSKCLDRLRKQLHGSNFFTGQKSEDEA